MWWTIIFSLLIAAICYLKFEEKITDIFKNSNQIILRLIYEKYSQEQIFTFLIFIIVLCSITIISLIVKLFGRELSVHKLKFLNAELEIFEDVRDGTKQPTVAGTFSHETGRDLKPESRRHDQPTVNQFSYLFSCPSL